ncbi:MAG: head decoration protein [Devosia sp.]|nr:head decoration protein [Devosia sp.]
MDSVRATPSPSLAASGSLPQARARKVTASDKYVERNRRQRRQPVPAAINIYGADATGADIGIAAIVRDAEVNGHCLVYHADRDQPAEKAAAHDALKSLGIIVR